MIPEPWNSDRPCYVTAHEKEHSMRECFFLTWREAPFPWFHRTGQPTFYDARGGRRWHLVSPGIRLDTDSAQAYCNVGSGPGPFEWAETPPNYRACKNCLAHWTEVSDMQATVRGTPLRVKKGQLAKLVEAIEGTELMEVEIRPTSVEDRPALVAEWTESGSKNEKTKHSVLLVGEGIIRLG